MTLCILNVLLESDLKKTYVFQKTFNFSVSVFDIFVVFVVFSKKLSFKIIWKSLHSGLIYILQCFFLETKKYSPIPFTYNKELLSSF